MRGVTAKQRQVLDYFEAYEKENGEWPTFREAAAALGCSIESIRCHCILLEKKGYMEHDYYVARSWRLTRPVVRIGGGLYEGREVS